MSDITIDDFMSGMLAELARRGKREIALDTQSFDAGCERAYRRLRDVAPALGFSLRFAVVLHPFHGDSPVVRTALADAGQRGLVGPGDEAYRLQIHLSDDEARTLLGQMPGGAPLFEGLGAVFLSDPGVQREGRSVSV
jgi:hypothetical protein